MDAVGAEASINTIVLLTGSCLKIGRKFLGPLKHSTKDVDRISDWLGYGPTNASSAP